MKNFKILLFISVIAQKVMLITNSFVLFEKSKKKTKQKLVKIQNNLYLIPHGCAK